MSISVKILQTSCCDATAGIADEIETAAARQGLSVSVERITDLEEVMKHDTSRFPALVINGEVRPWDELEGTGELDQLLRNLNT